MIRHTEGKDGGIGLMRVKEVNCMVLRGRL